MRGLKAAHFFFCQFYVISDGEPYRATAVVDLGPSCTSGRPTL